MGPLWHFTLQYLTRRQAVQFLSFTVPLDSLPQLAQPNPSLRLNCHSFRMAERREGSTPIWDGRSHVFLYAGCLAPCLSQYEYESARVARRLIGA